MIHQFLASINLLEIEIRFEQLIGFLLKAYKLFLWLDLWIVIKERFNIWLRDDIRFWKFLLLVLFCTIRCFLLICLAKWLFRFLLNMFICIWLGILLNCCLYFLLSNLWWVLNLYMSEHQNKKSSEHISYNRAILIMRV